LREDFNSELFDLELLSSYLAVVGKPGTCTELHLYGTALRRVCSTGTSPPVHAGKWRSGSGWT